MAIVAALGWSIAWLIRPFESILLFVLLWGTVTVLATRATRLGKHGWKQWVAPVVALVVIQGCAGVLTLFHNHAVTGSFTTMPYQLSALANGVPQGFVWQPVVRAPRVRFPEMGEIYNWQLQRRHYGLVSRTHAMPVELWLFFVTP